MFGSSPAIFSQPQKMCCFRFNSEEDFEDVMTSVAPSSGIYTMKIDNDDMMKQLRTY